MASSGMLRRVALVKTEISEELSASIIRRTRIGEVGRTLAVNSNRRTHVAVASNKYEIFRSVLQLLLTAKVIPT
jgi:hypothetical protein